MRTTRGVDVVMNYTAIGYISQRESRWEAGGGEREREMIARWETGRGGERERERERDNG